MDLFDLNHYDHSRNNILILHMPIDTQTEKGQRAAHLKTKIQVLLNL